MRLTMEGIWCEVVWRRQPQMGVVVSAVPVRDRVTVRMWKTFRLEKKKKGHGEAEKKKIEEGKGTYEATARRTNETTTNPTITSADSPLGVEIN